ncbi:hypothetical protein B0H14DRAFT_3525513 [Mycena olivaceomarginata]|nr:hypothetical protein B0H14DRAFT_3525513 [Mycena olivaceomarginata]
MPIATPATPIPMPLATRRRRAPLRQRQPHPAPSLPLLIASLALANALCVRQQARAPTPAPPAVHDIADAVPLPPPFTVRLRELEEDVSTRPTDATRDCERDWGICPKAELARGRRGPVPVPSR